MAKVFLSYNANDKDLVEKVAQQLGNDRCVFGETSSDSGELIIDEIIRNLGESDVFVLFISRASLKSKWVKYEINQARNNLEKELLDKFYPIIIDKEVKYDDPEIPYWIKKSYNLKITTSHALILKRIQQALRSVIFKKSTHVREIEQIFVGRNKEMQEFECRINNFDNWVPSCIIAYSAYEGIGRRTFMRHALEKAGFIHTFAYRPIQITLDSRESIESFIYKLNFISQDQDISGYDLTTKTIEEKIELAFTLIVPFIYQNERIFIIDEGGIVLPNGQIVDWFDQIVKKCKDNYLVFCTISHFKPKIYANDKQYMAIPIQELSKNDTKTLFARLLKVYNASIRKKEDVEMFLDALKGIPSQIIYAVNMIEAGIIEAKQHREDIIEYSDYYSAQLLNHIKKNPLAFQITLLLSQSEIISYDLIEEIFGCSEETDRAVQYLYGLSAFHFVLEANDNLRLNSSLSDFVKRTGTHLDESYNTKLKSVRRKVLKRNLDELVMQDYSEFLLSIKTSLENGSKINHKYYMPSLVLKYVYSQYDEGKYDKVISMCEDLLANTNYDSQIIRETKNVLLQSRSVCGTY